MRMEPRYRAGETRAAGYAGCARPTLALED